MAWLPNKPNVLFEEAFFAIRLDDEQDGVRQAVEHLPRDEFLAATEDAIVAAIVAERSIKPLVLADEEHFKLSFSDNGNQLRVEIPFSGDALLWRAQPNYRNSLKAYGEIDVARSLLLLDYVNANKTGRDWCEREFQRRLQIIRVNLIVLTNMLEHHHTILPTLVRLEVAERKRTESK